ncbi:sigma-54 dependent transcriptional regulator [Neisseria sp. ZJ106]|uniref:Sigma-54 dependent transcriptional regulator n=1 Tax=Neisseria lisongii TaxID=2912188 RepID=A0ABY7RIA9_9NEIS|nr:sigma-54 dependent transcriptional regulator [Neisseria lisongii]MCF7522086.1 sigma-54 dependent transcriptional regulator [Neisseria lisongii]WCL71372.1 sigma-54 dependent transcriptional regulator [Neisseria lisongii]
MRSSDILIVDDEVGIRDLLSEILQDEGYTVTLAENAEAARQLRYQTRPAMVLLDIWMPDCDGITLLKEWAKNGQLNMPVVMMSGHASIDTAVEATKIGALDFLEKPISLQKLLATVDRALKHGEMQAAAGLAFDKLGNSPAVQELNQRLEAVAKQNGPVLLTGEHGSPFETVARYFHKGSTPWLESVKAEHIVDMPLELLQRVSGGVLYVGDITQYSKNIQNGIVFLLSKAERYNVRIVAAGSQSPKELAESANVDGRLLELLSPNAITIPPLRSQPDDILFLINRILTDLAESEKIQPVKFSNEALAVLRRYEWPGNFEQLHSVVKKLALNADSGEIGEQAAEEALGQAPQRAAAELVGGFDFNQPLRELREELERRYFSYHIEQEGQNMSRVAQKVGLERTHLYRKLKQLGISVSRRSGEKCDE